MSLQQLYPETKDVGQTLILPVLHGLHLHARVLLDVGGRREASSVVILGGKLVKPQVRGAQLSPEVCEVLQNKV